MTSFFGMSQRYTVDKNSQWKFISASTLKKEVEVFVLACQDQAITTILMKLNIFHQPGSAKCHLYGSYEETVDCLLTTYIACLLSCAIRSIMIRTVARVTFLAGSLQNEVEWIFLKK